MIKLVSLSAEGFKHLNIHNLNFPPEGNILITGKNESGKSTLFEAIFFALTSELLVKKSRGYLDGIGFGKNAAIVDLIFRKNGVTARIKKTIVQTKSGTSLYIDFWENCSSQNKSPTKSGRSKDVDPYIQNFLGFDKEILLNSCFVKQKGLEGFMQESKQNRIKILNKLLNMEKITILKEKYKKEKKILKIQEEFLEKNYVIHRNENLITDLEELIQKLEGIQKEFRKIKNEYNKIQDFKDEYIELSKEIENINKLITLKKEKLEKEEKKLNELKRYKEYQENSEKIKRLIDAEVAKKESEINKLKGFEEKLKYLENNIEEIRNSKENLKIIQSKLIEIKNKLNEIEKYREIVRNINELNKKLEDISYQKTILNERIESAKSDIIKHREKIAELIDSKCTTSLENFDKFITLKKELDSLISELDILNEKKIQLEKYNQYRREYQLIDSELKNIEAKYSDICSKIESFIRNQDSIEEQLKEIEKLKKEHNNLKIKIDSIKDEYRESNFYYGIKNQVESINREVEEKEKELLNIENEITNENIKLIEKQKKSLFFRLLPIDLSLIVIGLILSIILNPILISISLSGFFIQLYLYFKEKKLGFGRKSKDDLTEIKKRISILEKNKVDIKSEINNLVQKKKEFNEKLSNLKQPRSLEIIEKEKGDLERSELDIKYKIQNRQNNIDFIKNLNSNENLEELNEIKKRLEKEIEDLNQKKKNIELKLEDIKQNYDINDFKENQINILIENKGKIDEKIKSLKNNFYQLSLDFGFPNFNDNNDINKNFIEKIKQIREKNLKFKNWSDSNLSLKFYEQFPILSNFISKLKQLENNLENELNEYRNFINNENILKNKISSWIEKLPIHYQNNLSEINKDYEQFTIKNAKLEQDFKKLDDFISSKSIEEILNQKDRIATEIENVKLNISKIENNIQKYNSELEHNQNSIPQEYKELFDQEDDLLNNVKNLRKNITELKTTRDNRKKKYIEEILDFFNDSITGSIEINDNNLNYQLEKKYEIIKKELDSFCKNVSKLIPNFTINSEEDQIINSIGEQKAKIGSLLNEIKISKKKLKEITENHNKIIKNIKISNNNLKDQYEKIKNDLIITEKAIELLERGENEILERVLPSTEAFLVKILPILTANRYKDASITYDYQIKIFDSKLGQYIEKTIFSGGTRDQIALAIRLAFAMATMNESNSKESFIFLDEPLGFFDDERKNALIDFLTHGLIAEKFAQRIVISNFSNIKKYFDFVIELDNGTVIEQYSTGSLETSEPIPQYELQEGEKYISIEFVQDNPVIKDDEYDYYKNNFILKNISKFHIKEIHLSIPNQNLKISSKYFYNLEPNQCQTFYIGFCESIIQESKLYFHVEISFGKNNKKYQKIEFIPSLKLINE